MNLWSLRTWHQSVTEASPRARPTLDQSRRLVQRTLKVLKQEQNYKKMEIEHVTRVQRETH